MYGYRKTNENGLMTNLNSISSSLSSLDTVGRRNNAKASVDNLITSRSHSIASTSLLWPKSNGSSKNNNTETYANMSRLDQANSRHLGSEIYYSGEDRTSGYCFSPETALNFMLIPTLLLTVTRQVFDFLGQMWLQILINFFTIILLIVALFGIRQHRISYITTYSIWALLNFIWNVLVICIYSKIRDVGLTEDTLSLYTGATSWWHANGPGCLPYNISSIQPTINVMQPNALAGCKLDYHSVETSQATLHALLSFISSLLCCCLVCNIRRNPKLHQKSDKLYRLSTLSNERTRVNQNPFPSHGSSRHNGASGSLRRAQNKTSSRSSQHSISSQRSTRRRRHPSETAQPTPRGSTSSTMQRSQKYGSLSSRRSNRKERRDAASLTYGTTIIGESDRNGQTTRARLCSLSSNDYLPSYQPPHSSNTNLLSSYGEISSIDSYNNRRTSNKQRATTSNRSTRRGNTNPTYAGSRSSIYSHANPNNNYDDLSYIYGNNSARDSDVYGANNGTNQRQYRNAQQTYEKGKLNSLRNRNGSNYENQVISSQEARVENHHYDNTMNGDTMTNAKLLGATNGGFQSFARPSLKNIETGVVQMNGDDIRQNEINNNYMNTDYQESIYREKQKPQMNSQVPSTFDSRSRIGVKSCVDSSSRSNQSQIYSNRNWKMNGNKEEEDQF